VQIERLLKAGVHGYILKNTGVEELENAIVNVHSGETYFSNQVTQTIMTGLSSASKQTQEVRLTPREEEVPKLLAKELTTNEIADQMCISHHTVESHRKNLIAKLDVRGTVGLVKYAVEKGLI